MLLSSVYFVYFFSCFLRVTLSLTDLLLSYLSLKVHFCDVNYLFSIYFIEFAIAAKKSANNNNANKLFFYGCYLVGQTQTHIHTLTHEQKKNHSSYSYVLAGAQVWSAAIQQVFFSLTVGYVCAINCQFSELILFFINYICQPSSGHFVLLV